MIRLQFTKIFGQKGRGVAEYALIIAFVLGLGILLSNAGIRDSIKVELAQVELYLRGVSYANALAVYGQVSSEGLKHVDNGERLSLDKEALTNLGKKFLGMTKADLKRLLHVSDDKNMTVGYKNGNPYGVILLDYEVENNGDNGTGVITKLRYNNNSFNSEDALEWMKGNYAPDGSNEYSEEHYTSGRFLLSNDTIDRSGAVGGKTHEKVSEKKQEDDGYTATVRGRFDFDDTGRVSSVTINVTRNINEGGWQRDVCAGLGDIIVTR